MIQKLIRLSQCNFTNHSIEISLIFHHIIHFPNNFRFMFILLQLTVYFSFSEITDTNYTADLMFIQHCFTILHIFMLGYNKWILSRYCAITRLVKLPSRLNYGPKYWANQNTSRERDKKFKIIEDPKQSSKLIFEQNGKCKVFEHKDGQIQMKWIMRVGTFFTVLNSFLMGAEMAYPIFGSWNMFSFSACAGMGFLFLGSFQVLAKRTIHQIYLHSSLEYVDVTFFNPFWKPQTITFHISEFQQLQPSYLGYIRVQLTSIGKTWIKIGKNEFRNVKDYEETLDCILLGKPITNIKSNPSSKGGKNLY